MPIDPAPALPFQVRHDDDELPFTFDPPNYLTVADVVADVVASDVDYDMMVPGICSRFEVWQSGVMVATARRDGETDNFIVGPPFDRTRGMSQRDVEALDRFFPGVLDNPYPG